MTDARQRCAALFGRMDSRDSSGLAAYLTPDAQFRYGSAPAVAVPVTAGDRAGA